ncbi:NADH dehydrogenase subunit [Trifolium repens]|nr:NADH dehydrogenase subunit [Trifolium repens]
MAYGACYLKGTRFFDRGGMIYLIAGPSPRSARRPIGIAAFVACPLYLGPGKRWQQLKGRGPCSASAPFLVNGAAESTFFSSRILRSLSCEFPCGEFNTFWALSIPSLKPRRKPPSPSDSISLLTLYMWAPDIYEGSPTPVTAFLSIAPKISIFANISRVSIYGSYGATLQQIFCFCSIASMILGALAAMAQTKVKRPLAHSSIGHVGYIRTGFSCGTIEGIQSLLIGIFIYALMTIDAFAIVLALRQTRVKYIADLGALAKTNPISAITFSITMFSYVGIPPLAGFCSKFYLFFAALGCGAYFLAPVGVVTSVIGCWAAGRLPRVSQFGGPKAVLRAPDT